MPSPPQVPERRSAEDELPPLPPMDDDGELAAVEDESFAWAAGESSEGDSLDDSTNEGEPIEAFGIDGASTEDGLLEGSEDSGLDYDGTDTLVEGAESGLLQDSDEGDGRDVRPDEAGMLQGDERDVFDDGGAEGTGEDPALAIDEESETERLSLDINPDDESIEDESLEDDDADRARASFEREEWPPRADMAWIVDTLAEPTDDALRTTPPPRPTDSPALHALHLGPTATVIAEGSFVAALDPSNGLWLSRDGGERFERISGCASATAAAIVSTKARESVLLAALYDPRRDTSALARIRLTGAGALAAEVVADLVGNDGASSIEDELARVEILRVRVHRDGGLETIVEGRFGIRRVKG